MRLDKLDPEKNEYISHEFWFEVDNIKSKDLTYVMKIGRDNSSTLLKLKYGFSKDHNGNLSKYLSNRKQEVIEGRE